MIGIGRGDGEVDREAREDRSFSLSLQVTASWKAGGQHWLCFFLIFFLIFPCHNLLPFSGRCIPSSGFVKVEIRDQGQVRHLGLSRPRSRIKDNSIHLGLSRPRSGIKDKSIIWV